jgi:hypothetical protein
MATDPLPWYYAYSPRYEVFHWMFQNRITHPKFQLEPQFIEQSVFDQVTYRDGATHYLCGCFIKQQRIYELLQTLPEDSYFLYTDVDYHVVNLEALWTSLEETMKRGVHMAFQYEPQGKPNDNCNINVGFGLFRVCATTREFFATVMKAAGGEEVKNDLDIITEFLPTFQGISEVIPSDVICMPYMATNVNQDTIGCIPVLCSNSGNYKENLREKYDSLRSVNLPIQTYIAMALANGRTPEELGLV